MACGQKETHMEEPIIIIGCGAQAKYVLEIFQLGKRRVSVILDPVGGKIGQKLGGVQIEAFDPRRLVPQTDKSRRPQAIVCASDPVQKCALMGAVAGAVDFVQALHPKAVIASTARIGDGAIINAGAVIQPYARIGQGCMVHAGVVVEHDCEVGDYANLAPNVALAGSVHIGQGALLGIGSAVVQNINIGQGAVVGAGALVLKDVPAHTVVYGTPAKTIRKAPK